MPNYDPVYLSLSDKPRAILNAMDDLITRRETYAERYARLRRIPWWIFFAGIALFILDRLLLGYNVAIMAGVTIAFTLTAIYMSRRLASNRPGAPFPPRYQVAHEIIHTLRDDVHPQRTFIGHLDLTGTEQKEKVMRTTHDAQNRALTYFRDEWLALKGKLYDGNILRLSAIDRIKRRDGYYKRSKISGKMKYESPKFKNVSELQIRIVANPELYDGIGSTQLQVGTRIGKFQVVALDTSGGMIQLSARMELVTLQASHVLELLRLAYNMLQRKA